MFDTRTAGEGSSGHAESRGAVGLDELFHILQNERRRLTLEYLASAGTSELGAVAEHVAAGEHDIDVEDVDASQRKRVYISLYQSHVPTLAEHDVVEYDQEENVVAPGENLREFDPYLEGMAKPDGESSADREFPVVAATSGAVLGLFGLITAAGGVIPDGGAVGGILLVGLVGGYTMVRPR